MCCNEIMVTIQIWTNRLVKEFDGIESRLPSGVSLSSHTMNAEAGVCRAVFNAMLTAPSTSSLYPAGVEDAAKAGGEAVADSASIREDGVGGSGERSSSINGRSDQAEEEDKEVGEQDAKGNKNVDGQEEDTAESRTDTIQEGEVVEGGEERSLGGEGKIDGEPAQQHGLDNDSEAKQGEKEKDKKPAVPLAFKIEMDLGLDTRYPFESPVIRVLEGLEVIPSELLSAEVLVLPGSDSWTPSCTVIATLQDISNLVIHAREAGLPTGEADGLRALERGELRPGSLVSIEALGGYLFPCTPPPSPIFSNSMMMMAAPLTGSRKQLDRYLGVTDRQVLELEAHRTRINQTVVILAIDLRTLSKLKFRRGSSVTLVMKGGGNREFLTPQSHECVQTVTDRLRKMGIAGHQTTAGAEKQVDRAKSIMASLERKERQLKMEPSLDLVQESMDLFRQAAELFSAAEDPRHEQVVEKMHAFLQRPEVLAVLEGRGAASPAHVGGHLSSLDSSSASALQESGGDVPHGQVLQRSPQLPLESKGAGENEDDDDSVGREESSILEGGGGLDELQKMLDGDAGNATRKSGGPPA